MGLGLGVARDKRPTDTKVDEEMFDLVTQLTNEVNWRLRELGLSRADLATRMGVSPGRVSQILGGAENLTLRTLAALSAALDARLDIVLSTPESSAANAQSSAGMAGGADLPAEHPSFPRRRPDGDRISGTYRRR